MNIKINTICFIFLLFLLIGVASAAEMDNETLQQTIKQPEDKICQIASDSPDEVLASPQNIEKLESSVDKEKLEAGKSKKAYASLITDSKLKVNINAPDVKMHYKDGSKLTVTVKDELKNAVKKSKVKITIDGKTYTKTTDSNGKASINLNLKSGKYAVTTTFDETKNYHKKSVKSTVTIKSTIKCDDMTKYYKNKASYYSKFYDKKGRLLKGTSIKFKLNSKSYTVKTDKKGVGKLAIDLKPGKYSISSMNSKTSETITKSITVKTLLETKDLTMNESDGSKFSVKVLNSKGKVSPNKKVTLKVNGKTYTPKSNSQGIASQTIDLPAGKYTITTEYEGLMNTNHITVNKGIKRVPFSHITMVPDHVNVTVPYAFHNSAYTQKTGPNGIIKLPKNDVFAIHISESKYYLFSTTPQPNIASNILGYESYLVPFDGSDIKSDYNKDNLKGDGVLISKANGYTEIEFRSTTQCDADLFGLTMDKHKEDIEIITYIQNDLIKARIQFFTGSYDEVGLRSNLGKLYEKNAYEINYNSYDQLTMNNTESIRFTNTGKSVIYDDSRNSIMPSISREDIKTKLIVNGIEELEKSESISYGRSDLYNVIRGFEVLQSYAIINEKVTYSTMDKWLKVNSGYLSRIGIMNIYGMFLAGLETAWLADEIADNYAKEFNVKWNRERTTTILGGINFDDTYLHILNADMGMNVAGNGQNSAMFRLMNSFYLPNIESYVLNPVAERYSNNLTNSLDSLNESVENNKFSIAQIGEMFYILCEDGSNATIVINSTSGISNAIIIDDDFAYKGSLVPTACDCCSVGTTPVDIIDGIRNTYTKIKQSGGNIIDNIMNKIHPLTVAGYMVSNLVTGIAGKIITGSLTLGLASTIGTMMGIHGAGNYIKNKFVDKKDWHWAYEHVAFTRDGYMQGKKFFNIPKDDGTYDFVEVTINPDGSLNRNDALYVGDGYTKKLSKSETYQYFTEEKWTACNIPRKYQIYEVPYPL
ncbi:hypothetical protein [Methanobrevibacter sp.]|uniref:hypothetical protein n=1 Tax=Methanobrevibacter sp. TaxID=66852 RepID=UPI002E787335|nr:hypothetical protein [Methanobrevibacter sp.]MEE1335024.1 hypothetical protein [Methanobrevibacter sp.]